MSDYDDYLARTAYDDESDDFDDEGYEDDPYGERYDDDDPDVFEGVEEFDASPLIPKWRMNLEIAKYWLWYLLDRLKRWLKWHNHKCKVCGKPATIDGEVCPNCWIPF